MNWLRSSALRRPERGGPFEACGARFLCCSTDDGWCAVALLAARRPLSAGADPLAAAPIPPDFWPRRLAAMNRAWASAAAGRVLKDSPGGRVVLLDLEIPSMGVLRAAAKQGRPGALRQRLGTCWHGPKEWREFWLGHRLRSLGVRTPLPVACLWRRDGRRGIRARLLTSYLAGAVPLDEALRRLRARGTPGALRRRRLLVDSTAELVGAVGRQAYWHRDLKAGNLLVTDLETAPRAWVIDLDGVGRERRPYGTGFQKSLARLARSLQDTGQLARTDCLRGLLRLAAGRPPPAPGWKTIWNRIAREVAARQARGRRHDRLGAYR